MRVQSKLSRLVGACGFLVFVIASLADAQGFYVYPARGQSPEQQSRDQYECHNWAVSQTGVNPTAAAAAPSQGGAVRGAARGAAVGAIGGAIAGDAGKGAAIGAATGGVFGGIRQADQNAQQQAQQQNANAAYQQALRACLTGRGYSVQ
jgi:hypothetical protein